MGSTCYLRCYTINMFDKDEEYDSIGLQSPFLDEVFRYEYEYIDMVRAGINLAVEPKVVYKVPFGMNDQKYELEFRIGHDNRLGLLEDLDRKGELILPLHTNEIQECYDITNVLHRLAMFMTSNAEVPFKRITLYRQGLKAGWFYCSLISEDIVGGHGGYQKKETFTPSLPNTEQPTTPESTEDRLSIIMKLLSDPQTTELLKVLVNKV